MRGCQQNERSHRRPGGGRAAGAGRPDGEARDESRGHPRRRAAAGVGGERSPHRLRLRCRALQRARSKHAPKRHDMVRLATMLPGRKPDLMVPGRPDAGRADAARRGRRGALHRAGLAAGGPGGIAISSEEGASGGVSSASDNASAGAPTCGHPTTRDCIPTRWP